MRTERISGNSRPQPQPMLSPAGTSIGPTGSQFVKSAKGSEVNCGLGYPYGRSLPQLIPDPLLASAHAARRHGGSLHHPQFAENVQVFLLIIAASPRGNRASDAGTHHCNSA